MGHLQARKAIFPFPTKPIAKKVADSEDPLRDFSDLFGKDALNNIDVVIREERNADAAVASKRPRRAIEQHGGVTVPANNTVLWVSSEFFKTKVRSRGAKVRSRGTNRGVSRCRCLHNSDAA